MFSNRDLTEMERVHDVAAHSPEDFLANPINAYLLVKRLTVDWADLQDVMTDNTMGKGDTHRMYDLLVLCVCLCFALSVCGTLCRQD